MRIPLICNFVLVLSLGVASAHSAQTQGTQFRVGDRVVIVAGTAQLRQGSEIVATITKDQQLVVTVVKGRWVGCALDIDGKIKTGWISESELVKAPEKKDRAVANSQPEEKVAAADPVAEFVERALVLANGQNKEAAYCALVNAREFGLRIGELEESLRAVPEPGAGIQLLDKDGRIDNNSQGYTDRVARFGNSLAVEMKKIQAKVKSGKRWDDIEAAMLMDKDLVGDGKCVGCWEGGAEKGLLQLHARRQEGEFGGFLFLRPNKLTLQRIITRYGKPQWTLLASRTTQIHYYGRFLVVQPRDRGNPLIFRVLQKS